MVRILSDPRHVEALEALKRYDVVMAPLEKRIAELRAELAELDRGPAAVADPAVAAASREEWTARWNAATVTERRNLIRQALRSQRIVIAAAVRSGRPKFRPKAHHHRGRPPHRIVVGVMHLKLPAGAGSEDTNRGCVLRAAR